MACRLEGRLDLSSLGRQTLRPVYLVFVYVVTVLIPWKRIRVDRYEGGSINISMLLWLQIVGAECLDPNIMNLNILRER